MTWLVLVMAAALGQATPAGAPLSMAGMAHGDMTAAKVPTLLPGYGDGGFLITTRVPQAQAFFDNGMQLAHAFAHKAAVDAMKEAVRLDPTCAMCLWGQAWASGPTINYGKNEVEVADLAALVDKAAALAKTNGTDCERALIAALKLRYQDGGGSKPGDLDFAKAMTALGARYPDDDEIAVLAADAWLQTAAERHDQWELNGRLAMTLLEPILARRPDYTPAIHFYIHATEAAGVPARAERYADKLAQLAPRASHLVHMASHTFYWVGRYQDAADVNRRAAAIDVENARFLGLPPPQVWDLIYHVHNVTFGLGGALMADDAATALALGRPLVTYAQSNKDLGPFRQVLAALGYAALGRYAPPAEVLALPVPVLPYAAVGWHYARGEALARQGKADAVRAEAAAISATPNTLADDDATRPARQVTFITRAVLIGRAAMLQRRYSDAALAFREAAELQEDARFSNYADPPIWWYPVRRDLAAALLAAGRRDDARREARATLAYRARDPYATALLARLGSAAAPMTQVVPRHSD